MQRCALVLVRVGDKSVRKAARDLGIAVAMSREAAATMRCLE